MVSLNFLRVRTLISTVLLLASTLHAGLSVTDPTCERLTDPLGIDSPAPRFCWKLASAERDVMQTAYQIRVAASEDAIKSGKADIWDSGKVASPDPLFIQYAGPKLTSATRYVWNVQVWDNQNRTATSTPASFEMGLLDPADWKAQWIGRNDKIEQQPAPLLRKNFKRAAR